MPPKFDLTITISSFNSDDKVGETLRQLFLSDVEGLGRIELLVVDDGSPKPVADVIAAIPSVPPVFELRLIEQKNSGIGATRNRGYREAKSNLVLFLDDDILVKNDTIKAMLKAMDDTSAAVIFGGYPFVSHSSESLRRFAVGLYGYDKLTDTENFEKVDAITSGLLIIDKSKLPDRENFYRNDMRIPAAEEHEVIARFHKMGISIVSARHISGIHNHHLELKWLVQQQYKYGLATAEAFAKVPHITEMEKFADLRSKLDFGNDGGFKIGLKSVMASRSGRKFMLFLARGVEKLLPNGNHDGLFGLTASSYFWSGYRDGVKRSAHAD